MKEWNKNKPGKYPLCIVGAGFSMANLKQDTTIPFTEKLIKKTIENDYIKSEFPVLNFAYSKFSGGMFEKTTLNLNDFWKSIYEISSSLQLYLHEIEEKFKDIDNHRIKYLSTRRTTISSFISTMLGIELKKMLCYWYSKQKIDKDIKISEGVKKFIKSNEVQNISWVSLNYDTVLETILSRNGEEWDYWFGEWIQENENQKCKNILIKPHGSLNVWFESKWDMHVTHKLNYVENNNKLETCDFNKVGLEETTNIEYRPWLIGYLPDYMKDEIKSSSGFVDAAHDLCKANISYMSLRIKKASSIYILGYSMPNEDQWILKRIAELKRDISIYVASKKDTNRIINQLEDLGFKCYELSSDGSL